MSAKPGALWFWLFVLVAGGTVAGALYVRAAGIDAGRIGSYFGILILLAAFVALLSAISSKIGWKRTLAGAAFVVEIGGGAEILSLYTGVPFGRYRYTDWWLPYVHLGGGGLYPLLLPLAWFIIVCCCYLAAASRTEGVMAIFVAALLAALTDLVLEPVLTRVVGFWLWLEPTPLNGAPYLNFAGWLATSLMGAAGLQMLGFSKASSLRQPFLMLCAMLLFTGLIGLGHGENRAAYAFLVLALVVLFFRPKQAATA